MLVVDRLISRVSPEAALRRSLRLTEKGRHPEAFALLTLAAKAGVPDAEYRVAQCYLQGSGVPLSRSEGARWLERAARDGSVEAQVLLSALCIRGLANAKSPDQDNKADPLFMADTTGEPDFETAKKWAERATRAGSAEGMALLAYVLTCGPESMRDLEGAHRLYKRSATAGCPQGHLGYALSLARVATDLPRRQQMAEALRRAADADLPVAIYLLGVLTEQGVGLEQDLEGAAKLYRRAAEAGQRSAQVRWGTALLEGRGVAQDRVTGEVWLRRALAGDPDAASLLGDLFARRGPQPNYVEAAEWYRRAAEVGHQPAARALASLYLTGAGVAQDRDEAAKWLRVTADAGDPASQVDLANLVLQGGGDREDPQMVAGWFLEAARTGDLVAAFNVGVCLVEGIGLERDEKEAASWLRRAAEGVTEAQYMYGRMLADGRGVPLDLKEARNWLLRASDAGMVDAQVALAEMLVNGRGGAAYPTVALSLFEQAAAKGHSGAMFALGALHAGGYNLPAKPDIALRWFRAAAELGHGHAQMMLGRYLSGGLTGEPNREEARLWLERAVAQGVPEAEHDLAQLGREM